MVVGQIPCIKVGVVAEGISFHGISWFMSQFVVVLGQFYLLSGSTGADFLGFYPICQISVVCPNKDGKNGAAEQV